MVSEFGRAGTPPYEKDPHNHVCLLFDSVDEWRQGFARFILSGLELGEKCICLEDDADSAHVRGCLIDAGVDVARLECTGQLSVLRMTQVCTEQGNFDPDRAVTMLAHEAATANASGYRGLRLAAEMTGIANGQTNWARVHSYESKVNRGLFPGLSCVIMCQYDRKKLPPEVVREILMAHPLLARGNHVYRNFYYVPPDELPDTPHEAREVDQWLDNLERERQSIQELRASEQRYRALFEQSMDAISVVSPGGQLVEANRAYLSLFGYSGTESVPINVEDVYADAGGRSKLLAWMASHDALVDDEVRLKNSDGAIKDCIRTVTALRAEDSTVIGYLSVLRDITRQKQTEGILLASEEKYRALFEQSMDAIALVSPDGRILEANQAYLDLFGCSREEVGRLNVASLYTDGDGRTRFLQWAESHDALVDDEVQLRRLDGSVMDCLRTVVTRRGEHGEVIGFQNVIRDITRHKEAVRELLASEEKYRALVEHSMDAISLASPDGQLLEANEAYLRLFGYVRDEIDEVDVAQQYVDPQARGRFLARMESHDTLVDDEVKLRKKDGTVMDCLRSVVTRRAADGKVLGFQNVIRDVTERKRWEEELKDSHERIHHYAAHLEKVREDERAGIARELHDQLGQALTVIKMDLASMRQGLARGQSVDLEKIASTIRLVESTANDVRRISSELRPVILDDFGFVAAMEWYQQQFQTRTGILCRLDVPEEPNVDRNRSTALYRIFQELLTNVARHAAAKSMSASFKLADSFYVLTVADDGCGMDEAVADRGSSLGFMGIRERLAPFGGTLAVAGMPGKGTRVTVTMPLHCEGVPDQSDGRLS